MTFSLLQLQYNWIFIFLLPFFPVLPGTMLIFAGLIMIILLALGRTI
uniref:Uncharacterized protein n=1 Tax=Rhizophora mucronata TaxID=61149 RepID=A0A2P2QL77_RHIMU